MIVAPFDLPRFAKQNRKMFAGTIVEQPGPQGVELPLLKFDEGASWCTHSSVPDNTSLINVKYVQRLSPLRQSPA